MCPFVFTMTIGLFIELSVQNPTLETQAVSRVRQISVSQLDPSLPDKPFALWLNQTFGPRAGVSWQLTDCGVQPSASAGAERDIQACVEMTALLPDDRKVIVVVWVGDFKKGLYAKPRIQFAVIESKRELVEVRGLGDLPEMLRNPLFRPKPKPVSKPVVLPAVTPAKVSLILPADKSPPRIRGSGNPPGIPSSDYIAPPRSAPRRVSEGVLMGNVISKVAPNYPVFARQNRISGEVKVEVTIAEDGRVIAARAVSGPEPLLVSAEEAARKWVFNPTLLNGLPIQIQGVITFVFTRP